VSVLAKTFTIPSGSKRGTIANLVSKELCALPNLREVNVYFNSLAIVPVVLFDLPLLKRLQLSHNLIAHIPPGFSRLRNLQYLNLSNNRLTSFVDEVRNLTLLRTLFVRPTGVPGVRQLIPSSISHVCTVTSQRIGVDSV
jgi:hypothetical protein